MLPKRKAPPAIKRRDSNGLAYYGHSRFTPFYEAPYQDSLRSPWRSRFLTSPRLLRRLVWFILLPLMAVAMFVTAFTTDNSPTTWLYHTFDAWAGGAQPRMANRAPKVPLGPPIPCLGPRGRLLGNSTDDDLHPVSLPIPYPTPFAGSHDVLGLDQTWMTPEDRYGPYGLDDDEEFYSRSRVDWDKIDWGALQNECLSVNKDRFPSAASPFRNDPPRFAPRHERNVPERRRWDEFPDTRRTAIVIRAYDGYDYKPQDLHHIRSLIVEAGLKSGAEFSVILLVHIRDASKFRIWDSREEYNRALEAAQVPREFHSITVLWSNPLLESWYPGTLEHDTFYQVFQPMQLLALHYPEFDHYWQFEMDMRFTGDAGRFLKAMDDFSRREPRKQSHERSTFLYDPAEFADYDDFQAAVDVANQGGSHYWGPAKIREVSPIGPEPPTSARADNFHWGVGEDADVVVTSICADARESKSWVFSGWVYGFRGDSEGPPRFFCPPAIQRASRTLLISIHNLQLRGLRIASEATLPSFALWLGLKLSYPPLPWYLDTKPTKEDHDGWFLGGPNASNDGWGRSDPQWGAHSLANEPRVANTFWWSSGWSGDAPKRTFQAWLDNASPDALPEPLVEHDGRVYMPNMIMHPVKSN